MSRQLVLLALVVLIAIATEVAGLRASGPSFSPGSAPSSDSSVLLESPALSSISQPPESSTNEENGDSPAYSPQGSDSSSSPQGSSDGSASSPQGSPASSPDSKGETKNSAQADASSWAPSDGGSDDYADYY